MTDDVLPTLDSLRLTARAWQDILGDHRAPLATGRMLQNSLTELWWALETLTELMADPGGPYVVLGLTGRAGKAQDGDEPVLRGGGGAGGRYDPEKGGIVLTGGHHGQAGPREPLRWPRPPTGPLEDFLEL